MALDPVPWFVGSGARHSAAAARNLAWNATGGATGIATPSSLQVRQTSTASNSVQIMPGGAVIESTYQGALQQSYTVRNASATTVSVPPNTSTSTRTYYVTVEVNDPTYAGAEPPSVANGPYVDFKVRTSRQSVHPENLLATIALPPNSVITNGIITDRRELANPKWKTVNRARPSVASDEGMKLSSTTGEWFPGDGTETGARQVIDVPSWATRMIVEPCWYGVRYAATSNCYGSFWISYGPSDGGGAGNEPFLYKTQEFQFDSAGSAANAYRTNWLMSDDRAVGANMRGKPATFAFRAKRNAASTNNAVSMDGMSGLSLKVTFLEEPDPSTE